MGILAGMLAITGVVACAPTSTIGSPSDSASANSTGAGSSSDTASSTGPTTTPAMSASAAPTTTTSTASTSATCPRAATASLTAEASPADAGKATLADIRAAQGTCGDEVIFDIDGVRSVAYRIGYQEHLTGIGRGDVIPVKGAAVLVVSVAAPSYDDAGDATYQPKDPKNLVDVSGLSSVQQVAWAGSFEGSTLVGIGLDSVHPFRVITTPGKNAHLIVEIAP